LLPQRSNFPREMVITPKASTSISKERMTPRFLRHGLRAREPHPPPPAFARPILHFFIYFSQSLAARLLIATLPTYLLACTINWLFEAFVHESIILLLPPPIALPVRLQYDCSTITQYSTSLRSPVFMPYNIQYCAQQYRVKANLSTCLHTYLAS